MDANIEDLGYANFWKELPHKVSICQHLEHNPETITIGKCLTETFCKKCKYKYTIDSSD